MTNDPGLIQAVEDCTFPAADFHHREHVRLAWLYLRAGPYPQALERMIGSIRRFAAHVGAPDKFHYTMTEAWIRVVHAAITQQPADTGFDALLEANPHLLNVKILEEFYSASLLNSPEAKARMVEPDLKPLPQ